MKARLGVKRRRAAPVARKRTIVRAIVAVGALSIAGLAFGAAVFIARDSGPGSSAPNDARTWTSALNSPDARVREGVLTTYGFSEAEHAVPPPCAPLTARLLDIEAVRQEALAVLVKEARASRCVAELIGILADSPAPHVRAAAAYVLGEATATSVRTAVIDALLRAIARDTSARRAAIVALGTLNDSSRAVLATLENALRDTHDDIRADALESLLHVEPAPERLEALAITALADRSVDVRAVAVLALERAGARADHAPMIVNLLLGTLVDPANEVRARSADALAWIGIGSPVVIRALETARRDTSTRVSTAASRALSALRRPP